MSYAKIRPRRSTKTEWEMINPVLMEGELGIEYPDSGIGTGLCKFKLGDGFKSWSQLPYAFDAATAESIYGGTVSVFHNICLRTEAAYMIFFILSEIIFDITKGAIKIGDGEHTFRQLEYIGYNWEMDQEYDFGNIDNGEIVPGPDDKDYNFGNIDLI